MELLFYALLTLHSPRMVAAATVSSRVTIWNDNSSIPLLANVSVPTNVPPDLTNVVAMAAGTTHCLMLRSDGSVTGLGTNTYGQTSIPSGLTNVIAIAAASSHSMALKRDGTVAAWGNNANGQTQVPYKLSQVVAIAALDQVSLALRADQTLVFWGKNIFTSGFTNFLKRYTNAVTLVGMGSTFYLLNADHSVAGYNLNSGQVTVAADFTNIVAIAVGQSHNLALRDNGFVVCWPLSSINKVPTNLNNVVAISAGWDRSLALKRDGTITAWGRGNTNTAPPLEGVIAVANGTGFNVALTREPPGPEVFMQPSSFHEYQGSTVFLTAGASGRPPLRYQWQHNQQSIPGATNACLSVTLDPQTVGEYVVQITNDFGAATSSSAILDLKPFDPPFIYCQPSFQTTHPGGPATFKAGISSRAPLQFQWRRNGIPLKDDAHIQGCRSPILTLGTTQAEDCGRYSVVAESQAGSVVSQEANLSFVAIAQWGFERYPLEIAPLGLTNVVGIAAGGAHNMALTADGRVIAWGANYAHQLDVPSTLTNVVSIAAGDSFSMAGQSDGHVIIWGRDPTSSGAQRTNTLSLSSLPVAIAAGYEHYLLLMANGTVQSGGGYWSTPAGLTNLIGVSCGETYSLGLKKDGRPVAWGDDYGGQTNVPPDLTNIIAIASDYHHKLALRSDGTVAAWGANDYGQATVPAGLTNVIAVACGYYHSLALTRDGSVVAWGFNSYGQTDVPPGLTKVMAIAGGYWQSLALREDGTVVVWGNRVSTCVPENLTNAVALANGGPHRLALDSNGIVHGWGQNALGEIDIPKGLSDVKFIAADNNISLAIRSNGTLVAWGAGTTNSLMNPPPGLTNVTAIASCFGQVIALKSDGLISTWGYLQPELSQVPPNLTNVIAVAAGGAFFMALTSQGSVVGWGYYPSPANLPCDLTNITAIAAGYSHALALKSDGTVVAWGSYREGQTNIPPGLTNVIAIAASQNYSLALKKDGTLAAWGLINQLPEAQIPVLSSRATTIAAGPGWGMALLATPPTVLRLETPSSNLAGGIFRLKLMGEFGQSLVVEASTNLSQWDRIAILTNTSGTFFHDDAAAGQFPQRFYRARSPKVDEGLNP